MIFPYIWSAIVLIVFLTSLKMIWGAIRTGEIPDTVWGGADNSEDHYGFMLRLLFLILIAGVALFMMTKIPEAFSLLAS
jgi:hypothetical protein